MLKKIEKRKYEKEYVEIYGKPIFVSFGLELMDNEMVSFTVRVNLTKEQVKFMNGESEKEKRRLLHNLAKERILNILDIPIHLGRIQYWDKRSLD